MSLALETRQTVDLPLHGGNRWAAAQMMQIDPANLLDFSVDLNPMGPPVQLMGRIGSMERSLSWYPEPTYRAFREALAGLYGADPFCFLPGNGSADLIHLISRWQARRSSSLERAAGRLQPLRVGVVVPTFTEYERAVRADGGQVQLLQLREEEGFSPISLSGSFPPERAEGPLRRAEGPLEGIQLLFLCNPNNPTGTIWPREQLLDLIRACEEKGVRVVVDEAYMDLVEDSLRNSLIPQVQNFRSLIVLRSFTKSFAIPGFRLGFLAAHPSVAEQLRAIQPPWPVGGMVESVGRALIREQGYLDRSRQLLRVLRTALWEGLCQIPSLTPFPSVTNFFLCRIERSRGSGPALARQLQEHRILIRTCDDFTGLEKGRYIRLAVRPQKENQRLLELLRELLRHAA